MVQARRTAAEQEPDQFQFGHYLNKPATPLLEAYPDWLKDNVGIDPSTMDAEQAFSEGVRLSLAVHKQYQTSNENRDRIAAARAAREESDAQKLQAREAKAAARAERQGELDEKRRLREESRAAKEAARVAVASEKPASVKKAPAAKEVPAKKAPVRRSVKATSTDAPF